MVVEIYECMPVKIEDNVSYYLRLKDIALAKIDGNKCIIMTGKYKDQTINLLDNDYKKNTLVCGKTFYQVDKNNDEELSKIFNDEIKQMEFKKIVEQDEAIILEPLFGNEMLMIKNKFNFDDKRKELFESIIESGGPSFMISEEQKNILLSKRSEEDIKMVENEPTILKPNYDINKIYEETSSIVIGQEKQIKTFLSSIIFNQKISNLFTDIDEIADVKKTILLCGSTGTGKTLMIKTIANLLGIPYIVDDASRYTAVGYHGASVEDLLVNLVATTSKLNSNNDISTAQNGIIFIDEIDKICRNRDDSSHIGTTDVQESLLKLIEGTTIRTKIRKGFIEENFEFDTRKVTFVLSGAFQEIINNSENVIEDKLIEYGMIHELIGRITPIIKMNTPTKENLKSALMYSKRSYLLQLIKYFESIGIKCDYTDDYINYIVECAYRLNDGYRGLKKAIDTDISESLFDLMAGQQKKLFLDRK